MCKKFKIFFVIFFFINLTFSQAEEFWSNKVDGPRSNESAIKLFDGKKLDPIEGLWHSDGLGTLVIFKDQNKFKMYIVEGPTDFNGTLEATIIKRDNEYDFIGKVWYMQADGSYRFGTQTGILELFGSYFLQKYDNLSDLGRNMDGKYTRVWPEDIYAYNNNVKTLDIENDDQKLTEEFFKLNWSNLDNPKNHFTQIPNSNSSVNILKNEIYLKGQKNINAFSKLLFDDDASENDMLIVDGDDFEYSIYINYINAGYVSLDDWKDINPNVLLAEMRETAKENVIDVKWIFKPKISDERFVTYSYEVLWNDNEKSLETTLISLGRKGYNEISFVKRIDQNFNPKEFENFATEFAKTIEFDEGYRHADYKSGDKTAAVGIGGLVAGTLGVKALANSGILSGLIAFASKFWWIILAPFVALAGIFNKKKTKRKRRKTKHE